MTPQVYRIGVISDTHGTLYAQVHERFAGVDMILHAGDVGEDLILLELETIAPVVAVVGNTDASPDASCLLESRNLTTPAGKIGLTHGHLSAASAYHPETLVHYFRAFEPNIIVFGHTHIPTLTTLGGVTLFNPGAAGRSRVGNHGPMVGMITLRQGDAQPHLEHLPIIP